MKKTNRFVFAVVLSVVLLSITWVNEARASASDRLTVFSINQPLRLPGVVLPPGKYAMQLMNVGARNLVRVTDADHTKVYATFFAVPEALLKAADEPRLELKETQRGEIPELRAWYYPGSDEALTSLS